MHTHTHTHTHTHNNLTSCICEKFASTKVATQPPRSRCVVDFFKHAIAFAIRNASNMNTKQCGHTPSRQQGIQTQRTANAVSGVGRSNFLLWALFFGRGGGARVCKFSCRGERINQTFWWGYEIMWLTSAGRDPSNHWPSTPLGWGDATTVCFWGVGGNKLFTKGSLLPLTSRHLKGTPSNFAPQGGGPHTYSGNNKTSINQAVIYVYPTAMYTESERFTTTVSTEFKHIRFAAHFSVQFYSLVSFSVHCHLLGHWHQLSFLCFPNLSCAGRQWRIRVLGLVCL